VKQLLLVRHAVAAELEPGQRDEARPLTPEGRARFARAAKGLERLGVELRVLRHSPWLRAVETADLLVSLVDGETRVDPLLARAPGRELLVSLVAEDHVALVGHEPWLSELLALLVGGRRARLPVDFKKGGVAWLDGDPRPGGMRLVAFLPPRVLRRI
jgi:phosphohistidine phosphatase